VSHGIDVNGADTDGDRQIVAIGDFEDLFA
jgi:hypothetical protein